MVIVRRSEEGEERPNFSSRLSDVGRNCVSNSKYVAHATALVTTMAVGFGLAPYVSAAVDRTERICRFVLFGMLEGAVYFSIYYAVNRVFRTFFSPTRVDEGEVEEVELGDVQHRDGHGVHRGHDACLRLVEERRVGHDPHRGHYMHPPCGDSGEDSGVEDTYVFIGQVDVHRNSECESAVSSDEEDSIVDIDQDQLRSFYVVKMSNKKDDAAPSTLEDHSKRNVSKTVAVDSTCTNVEHEGVVASRQLLVKNMSNNDKSSSRNDEETPPATLAVLRTHMISVDGQHSRWVS